MVRRSLGGALWTIVGLLAAALGAHRAITGTGTGREFLASVARAVYARVLAGRLEVAEVGGTLITGVWLSDVRLTDPDSTPVAVIPRVDVSYNPFDLSARRIVIQQLRLAQPMIELSQHASGRLNVEDLLPPRAGAPGEGAPPLVLLRDVTITEGSLVVRLRDSRSPDDSAHEIEVDQRDGRRRIRRFSGIDARLASLRLSSPREPGVRVDVTHLAVESSDPTVDLRDLRGQATVQGDSVAVAFGHVALPRSAARVSGLIAWPRDTVMFRLDVSAESLALGDVEFVDPRFPRGAQFRGQVRLLSRSGAELAVTLDPLDLRHAGGRVRGNATVVSRAGLGLVAVEGAKLDAERFDLEFARPFLDTLPFAGRLTGRTIAAGPIDALALDVDWVFRDSLVPGWPTTRVRGSGAVSLGGETGLAFHEFVIDEAAVDLGTVRRLIPPVMLVGEMDGAGTLEGPLHDIRFDGTLRHRDGLRPASEATGAFRFDTRRDTLWLDVDATVAPLALAGLAGSFPTLPLTPDLRGSIRLRGGLDSLDTHAELQVRDGGAVRADGSLILLPARRGARNMALRVTDLNLSRWLTDGPPSRLTFTAGLDVQADSGAPIDGAAQLTLAPSHLVDTPLDSGRVDVRFTAERIVVDSLRLTQPGLRTTGRGSLGVSAPAGGELRLELDADSLAPLDSLVRWAAHRLSLSVDTGAALRGDARATLVLGGALDSLTVRADGELREIAWRQWYVESARASVELERASAPRFAVTVALDSMAYGRMGFSAASAQVVGRSDSLRWFARSRVGDLGAFLAGGRAERDSAAVTIAVDSLAARLPGDVWLLEQPATLRLADSGLAVSDVALHAVRGAGRLRVAADLPRRGPASATIGVQRLPVTGIAALLQFDTLGVGGELDGELSVSGTRRAPRLEGTFGLRDASVEGFRAPAIDGHVTYGERQVHITGEIRRGDHQLLELDARLPMDLALVDVPRRRLPDPLAIRLRTDSVDLAALEILTTTLRDLRGWLTADVRVAGTWDAPRLGGAIELGDASAFLPALNARYVGIRGRFSLSGDTIHVDTLQLRSGPGTAVARGFVRLEDLTRPLLGLTITADRFTALDMRGQLSMTASGRVRLDGPLYGATLTGQGTVTDGVWYFRDAVQKRVIDLDAPWVRGLIDTTLLRDPTLRTRFSSRFLESLRIRNLELRMGASVWLRSAEANIQLTDTVVVDKTAEGYRLRGTMNAPRGTYRLVIGPVTREFVVTQGTVRFFGTPDLDAALDIEARHVVNPVPLPGRETAERVTVIAHIGGTLLVPRLRLRAEEREMPEAEVLSYLMFGLPTVGAAATDGQAGSTERYLLQNAVSSVVSGELSRVLISDLGVPLDYVEIRPGAPDDPISGALFAAGWQIGPRTFLIVNAGFCQGRPVSLNNTVGASLQYRLDRSWRTEASFEPLRTCSAPAVEAQTQSVVRQLGLDLLWERRF